MRWWWCVLLSALMQDKEAAVADLKSKAESEGVEGRDGEVSGNESKEIHGGNERKKEGGRDGEENNQNIENKRRDGG
ncbi:uncharacterized protein MONOS_14758 [Monocercomonoides exilis]|uniref:uncharacterized protein n=1 Tax=Monocercomonoides exilis TaxID=2049356 RepID=UPI003559E6AC|nr:hypothetical protein MONOS_14758 [Monocercomonoides exilis]|eukprot:MONOS_14758.1-p1 / transcript=MONOS_14758.1 / gene=MONOS_14758 / organism=Monocercomonoides_exilis_PA203 / gene_product=unspecified product / transcript_product=unspecified product / location=Mono_scaffold01065:7441-7671(+) / protein_length=77 / sequence_SO=supercontig / SO=protein_coding / is_pseudo=false